MILFPAQIKQRVDVLDSYLSATVTNPEWFGDVVAAQWWLEREIAAHEDELLDEMHALQQRLRQRVAAE